MKLLLDICKNRKENMKIFGTEVQVCQIGEPCVDGFSQTKDWTIMIILFAGSKDLS